MKTGFSLLEILHRENPVFITGMGLQCTLEGGGAEGALASPEFGGSEKRTEREKDNLLLIAPPESKS